MLLIWVTFSFALSQIKIAFFLKNGSLGLGQFILKSFTL
jgi:hypothetical protein